MKIKFALWLLPISVCLLFPGCSGNWTGEEESATVTINLGVGAGRAAADYPPDGTTGHPAIDELSYTVTFSGTTTAVIKTIDVSEGTTTLKVTIAPGIYNILVFSDYPGAAGAHYAEGSKTGVNIKQGANSVTIRMFDFTLDPLGGSVIIDFPGWLWPCETATTSLITTPVNKDTGLPFSPAPAPADYRYQWLRDGLPISGETSSTYTIANEDRGRNISVEVWTVISKGSITSPAVSIHPGKAVRNLTELTGIGSALAGTYILVNTTPISIGTPIPGTFTGTFDGNGKEINLAMTGTARVNAGLFEIIGSGGTVKNLSLKGSIVNTSPLEQSFTGAVAGQNNGTIRNVHSDVQVMDSTLDHGNPLNLTRNAGGITGRNTGTIENCYSTGNIYADNDTFASSAGGIVGTLNGGTINRCWAGGHINGLNYCGGIAGSSGARITNCVALNVNLTGTNNGRIWGSPLPSSSPTGVNNYGNAAMTGGTWTGATTSSKDGGDVDLTVTPGAADLAWWEDTPGWTINPAIGGNEASPWEWNTTTAPFRPKLWFE
jgi:hypothetical protein